MPYRQLERYTGILHGLVLELPRGDYLGIRKRILRLSVDPYEHLRETNELVTIAVNFTGVKVHKAGGWVKRKHGKKSRYIKLHFAVNTATHEMVSIEVSPDDTHDVQMLPGLVEGAGKNVRISKVIGDGAYDSSVVYALLGRMGIEVVVESRGEQQT